MNTTTQHTPVVLERLQQLLADPGTSQTIAEVAKRRIEAIHRSLQFVARNDWRIAFVGQIGIGKSSLIGVLGNLFVGPPPADRDSLEANSVLAVGAGGTTVCEVRIRTSTVEERGKAKLHIEPLTVEEMQREIQIFAEDEWTRRKSSSQLKPNDDKEPTAREVQRVIRHMTGLVERSEVGADRKKKLVDPLNDVMPLHDSARSLGNYLVDKAALLGRTATRWEFDGEDAYRELKRRFDDVNHGRTPTAMLPKRIIITIDRPIPNLPDGVDVELIDTRGFDGHFSGRRDIQDVFRDERAVVVLCVPFREAPGEVVKGLLGEVSGNIEFSSVSKRIQLVLMDHGDAKGVNGAGGDREFGQQLKQSECERALQSAGLSEFCSEENVFVFDTLKDSPDELVRVLDQRLRKMRALVESELREQLVDASSFLDNVENVRLELLRAEVDKRLQTAFQAHRPSGTPMRDPLDGLYSAITLWTYASQVYASCRRRGRYDGMDAYAAVRTGAVRAATDWLRALQAALDTTFRVICHGDEFAEVMDHVRLREGNFRGTYVCVIARYADAVLGEVESALEESEVWSACAREWGGGPGFKERIKAHLKQWSRGQGHLQAHSDVGTLCNALMNSLGGSSD